MTKRPHPSRRTVLSGGIASGVLLTACGSGGAKVNLPDELSGEFDYVITGAGSAGCVLANRLTEDADVSVLLLEAGGPDNSEVISTPLRLIELWRSSYDWAYETVPQDACHGRRIFWPRGKTLGGSSSLNGMIYVRGDRTDFDGWAARGNPGWEYESVLPYFKKSEDFQRGPSDIHGSGGPLFVQADYEPHILTRAMVDAAMQYGLPFNDDIHVGDQLGVSFVQLNVKGGKRQSTAVAFLRPALERPNLSLITNARAERITFDNKDATGVRYQQAGVMQTVRARREVLVCGGAIESPKVLMLSGIGNADHLRSVGVEPLHDLKGVGENLHDHTLVPVIFEGRGPLPPPDNPDITVLHAHAFMKSDPALPSPDMQPLFFNVPNYAAGQSGPDNAFTLNAAGIRPTSRGTIKLSGAGLDDPLKIDPKLLTTDYDVNVLVQNIKQMRDIADQSALSEYKGREIYPGSDKTTDADLADYARSSVMTYHHQCGTCAMGTGPYAVVDHELKVHGLNKIRVVDASVMPSVTSGNTNAPTIMIAEKAADLISGRAI